MTTGRNINFHMVYKDGFIYTISISTSSVERFNIANESWEALAPIPFEQRAKYQSAVVVDGKILALAVYRDQENIFSSFAIDMIFWLMIPIQTTGILCTVSKKLVVAT